jgi:hypothetical protein
MIHSTRSERILTARTLFYDVCREDRRTAQRTFMKLGRQIRGHIKPNSAKKYGLTRVEVELTNGVSKQLMGKEDIEEHLIAINVEHFHIQGPRPLDILLLVRSSVIPSTHLWPTKYIMEPLTMEP